MKTYSFEKTPMLKENPTNYYFNDIESYRPVSLDSQEKSITSSLKKLEESLDYFYENFNKYLSDLELDFGENFIKINDKSLGFVDREAFQKLLSDLKESYGLTLEKTNTFFKKCKEGNEQINKWLDAVRDNDLLYIRACENYVRSKRDYGVLYDYKDSTILTEEEKKEIEEKFKEAEKEVDNYNKLPNTPDNYGYWITKGGK